MLHNTRQDTTEAVDALMAGLEHPHHDGIQALRRIVLAAHTGIKEGVKWRAPSWRTHEYFATTHLRSKAGFGMILHRGAKVKELPDGGMPMDDPAGLLTRLADDRAMVEFRDTRDLEAKTAELQQLLRAWIEHL